MIGMDTLDTTHTAAVLGWPVLCWSSMQGSAPNPFSNLPPVFMKPHRPYGHTPTQHHWHWGMKAKRPTIFQLNC